MTRFLLVAKSHNSKTGPIPVSITSSDSCPEACPLKGSGCYAEGGPLAMAWRKVDKGAGNAGSFSSFLEKVAALPPGQLWRHNQAGDLPGRGDAIDGQSLAELSSAAAHTRGFTYTHKPVSPTSTDSVTALSNARAIEATNRRGGLTINLSADNMTEADELAAMGIAPVVVVLPATASDKPTRTPAGRTVVLCPAQSAKGEAAGVSCDSCQLCQVADRKAIVGFRAHGFRTKKASLTVLQGR